MVFAEDEAALFDKKTLYDIYYEVSDFEVDCVKGVEVLGTAVIDDISFLVIISHATPVLLDKKGYILLSSIRAILPRGIIPERVLDTGKLKRP